MLPHALWDRLHVDISRRLDPRVPQVLLYVLHAAAFLIPSSERATQDLKSEKVRINPKESQLA